MQTCPGIVGYYDVNYSCYINIVEESPSFVTQNWYNANNAIECYLYWLRFSVDELFCQLYSKRSSALNSIGIEASHSYLVGH